MKYGVWFGCFLEFFLEYDYITQKTAFLSDMSGGAILRDFSKMAISRDLGRVRRCAYNHFEAEIRGFLLIWALLPNFL